MTEDLPLGNVNYKIEEKFIPQKNLKFYIENPRVYSLFDRSVCEPSQEEMEEKLTKMDDVRELKRAISSNGGLTTPIYVKSSDLTVVEGNRRLAAYRMLYKVDPDKWKNIRCYLLPEDITDDAIFILLGQCHINGQKKWAPFEQAGYIYRRVLNSGTTVDQIAEDLGMDKSQIKKWYNVYKFMMEHEDLDSEHWSYYEEYLAKGKLSTVRKKVPNLDEHVVVEIKAGKISDAKKDIRETLKVVASAENGLELIQDYANGDKTLDVCFDQAEVEDNKIYNMIKTFRIKILNPSTGKAFKEINKDEIDKYKFELDQIKNSVEYLIQTIEDKAKDN